MVANVGVGTVQESDQRYLRGPRGDGDGEVGGGAGGAPEDGVGPVGEWRGASKGKGATRKQAAAWT